MPGTQTVYKVVRKSKRGFLYSAIVQGRGTRLRYRPGEVTRSPNGRRPFAFTDRTVAVYFRFMHLWKCDSELWEAEATDTRPEPLVAIEWEFLRVIKRFWAHHKDPEAFGVDTGHAPEGTVSCQTIKLVRKVA